MAQRAQRSLEAARTAVPEGTLSVGAGLLIAGVTAYGFQIISFRALGETAYTSLNALWGLVFVAAPGFFLPLEQEVGRALADRRVKGIGGGPVVRRAAFLGASLTGILLILSAAFAPWLSDELFHGESALMLCFAVGLVTYAVQHLTRGVLSGNDRFGPYGLLLGAEGLIRVVACAALWLGGVDEPIYYGLCLAIPPVLSSAMALRGQKNLMQPGPQAPWSELSSNLGLLLLGSVMAQLLSYAPLLAAQILATGSERDLVANFIVGFFLARIPILLFQAVQAALLPKLAGLAGSGRHDDFRTGLRKLLLIVVGVGVLGIVGGFTLGPWVGGILFGEKFTLGHQDLALLAAGSAAFIFALTLAQALIALVGHARVVIGWFVGLMGFIVVAAAGDDLFLRVELGFVVGGGLAALVMGGLLAQRMRGTVPDSLMPLVEVVGHEPLEI
jgi:O-antigen/teichoic acid export membrane protein